MSDACLLDLQIADLRNLCAERLRSVEQHMAKLEETKRYYTTLLKEANYPYLGGLRYDLGILQLRAPAKYGTTALPESVFTELKDLRAELHDKDLHGSTPTARIIDDNCEDTTTHLKTYITGGTKVGCRQFN
mgnify:CR=1 FL=1